MATTPIQTASEHPPASLARQGVAAPLSQASTLWKTVLLRKSKRSIRQLQRGTSFTRKKGLL